MRAAVVGASVAGVAACEALRRAGYEDELILIGDEDCVPYDRPPLSKQVLLGQLEPDDVALRPPGALTGLGVRELLGREAIGLDAAARCLTLEDGETLDLDGIILATGSHARRLPGQPEARGIHVLRTLTDAVAVRDAMRPAGRVVVIGAGFIGLEAASSARQVGCEVTVVEAAPEPMGRVLSPEVGRLFAAVHRAHGVDVRCAEGVDAIETEGRRARGVRLATGELLEGDLVVVGIGASPNTAWLEDSGLEIHDGVVCDETLRAAPGIYAAGDVARWRHPLFGEIRVEHWSTAGDHARTAAANLAADLRGEPGRRSAADQVPYFWSDQYAHKVQLAGWPPAADELHATSADGRMLVLFRRGRALAAAMTVDWPRELALHRRKIAASLEWEAAVREAPGEAVALEALERALLDTPRHL